jgi:hypothetical protein
VAGAMGVGEAMTAHVHHLDQGRRGRRKIAG